MVAKVVVVVVVLLNLLGCRLTHQGQAETNAEAWFNIALRPRKPEGSLGRTAQDVHLHFTQLLNYVVAKWMGDRYVLGFAPAPKFLRSQILCRLYKRPSDETINRGPPCVYARKKITYVR